MGKYNEKRDFYKYAEQYNNFNDINTADESSDREQIDLLEYAEDLKCVNNIRQSVLSQPEIFNEQAVQEEIAVKKPSVKKKLAICAISIFLAIEIVAVALFGVFTHYYNKLDYVQENPADIYPIDNSALYHSSYVTNVLLIGTDERTAEFSDNARSDSMMIMSVNTRTDTINLVSLERGMTVSYRKSNGQVGHDLLTHVFKHGGASLLITTVEETFHIQIDGYVRVNFNTFIQLIDSLGGVDIELDTDEVRGLTTKRSYGQIKRKLSVGTNHLNGQEALLYARLRWIDSDFHRIERQRKVIIALKEKMKDSSYISLLSSLSDVLPLVRTNISSVRMAKLSLDILSAKNNDIQQATIPAKGTYSSLGAVNFEANSQILYEMFYNNN